MKTTIISVANHKGGVGKTTTVANLGRILSENYKVLLIDLDAQANLTTSLLGAYSGDTIYEAMLGTSSGLPIVSIPNVENLYMVPSSLNLAMADIQLSTYMAREHILKELIESYFSSTPLMEFDFIILDCPPSLGLITLNALTASDYIIIPLICEVLPFKGLTMIMDFVDMVKKKLNPRLGILGILLTRWESSKLSKSIESRMRELLGDVIFITKIRKNIRLAEAPLENRSIIDYEETCNGAKDYSSFAKEFLIQIKK